MKQTIEWHQRALTNRAKFLAEKEKDLARMVREIDRLRQANRLYSAQIALAKGEGKDGFNEDRYGIRRLCVTKGE